MLHKFTDGLDHRADAWENLPDQYRGGDSESTWQKWHGVEFDALTEVEGCAWDAFDVYSVLDGFPSADFSFTSTYVDGVRTYVYRGATYATYAELVAAILADAGRLDIVGKIAGVTRTVAETIDEENDSAYKMCARNAAYYARIVAVLLSSEAGTPASVRRMANAVTGDPDPGYCEEWPAKYFVWTPEPTTRTRMATDDFKAASPCGVRGINGVALLVGDGSSVLGTTGGFALLTRDQREGDEAEGVDIDPLETEDGFALTTENYSTIYLEEVD